MAKPDEFLFIPRYRWESFLNAITGSEFICKNGVAMWDSIEVKGRNDSHAMCKLSIHLCKLTDTISVWHNFIDLNMKSNYDEERYDSPANDLKA